MKRFAVVSGGADGIGKEVVLEFLDAGFAVAAFDINDEKLAKVSEELKDRDFIGIHCNAIEEESVQKAFSQVMEHYGRVDALPILQADRWQFPSRSMRSVWMAGKR